MNECLMFKSALSEVLENGGLAQLGEHLLCKQGVVGSIPSSSTNNKKLNTKVALISNDEKATLLLINID
jgi:hypothetical protein